MLIAKAYPVPETGVILVKTGQNTSRAFELLKEGRLALQQIPEELNDRADGYVKAPEVKPSVKHALKTDRGLVPFFAHERVMKIVGSCKSAVDRIDRCQMADGKYCDKNLITTQVGTSYARLCWHHDLEKALEPKLLLVAERNHLAHSVNRVGVMLGHSSDRPVSYSELCWWATRHEVFDLLPQHVLDKIFNLKKDSRQNGINGMKDTDARYSTLNPREELERLVEPVLKFEVDEDPVLAYMRNPKPMTWTSEKYLKFIRSLPCVVTGSKTLKGDTDPVVAHHLIGHGEGKMAGKAHDFFTFPIRASKHRELHDNVNHWEKVYGSQLLHVKNTISKALQLGAIE